MSDHLQSVIKDFFSVFGTHATNSFELKIFAKKLKIKKFHIVMRDEIKDLPDSNFSAIINYQLSSQGGSHWIGIYSKDEDSKVFVFDSYGQPVLKELLKKFRNKIRTHDYEIQPKNSTLCGQISLLVIYLLKNNYDFHFILDELKDFFTPKNELHT